MSSYSSKKQELESRRYSSVQDIHREIVVLEELLQKVLIDRIENDNSIWGYFKKKLLLVVSIWHPQIKWTVDVCFLPQNKTNFINSELIVRLPIEFELKLLSSENDIENDINYFISSVRNLQNKYLTCTDEVLLNGLQELMRCAYAEDMITQKRMESVLLKYFNIELKEFHDCFANEIYFDQRFCDVAQGITQIKSIVSKEDNSVIERGIYVSPLNEE